jgi:hypothetical protein
MNKWIRVAVQVSAVLFFLIGVMFLPFAVWLDDGPNQIFGWILFILSVGTPWSIAYWLARIGFRQNLD